MAVAGVSDGALDQSLLKAPVTEIIDLSSDDAESSISHNEEGASRLDLGDSDEWSMFEDALAQEEENNDDERVLDPGMFYSGVGSQSPTDQIFKMTFLLHLKPSHIASVSVTLERKRS